MRANVAALQMEIDRAREAVADSREHREWAARVLSQVQALAQGHAPAEPASPADEAAGDRGSAAAV